VHRPIGQSTVLIGLYGQQQADRSQLPTVTSAGARAAVDGAAVFPAAASRRQLSRRCHRRRWAAPPERPHARRSRPAGKER
jgi:hypothetical protein